MSSDEIYDADGDVARFLQSPGRDSHLLNLAPLPEAPVHGDQIHLPAQEDDSLIDEMVAGGPRAVQLAAPHQEPTIEAVHRQEPALDVQIHQETSMDLESHQAPATDDVEEPNPTPGIDATQPAMEEPNPTPAQETAVDEQTTKFLLYTHKYMHQTRGNNHNSREGTTRNTELLSTKKRSTGGVIKAG
ncbi:hypothetical protein EJB05_34259, partial [Eragrostis curvula]